MSPIAATPQALGRQVPAPAPGRPPGVESLPIEPRSEDGLRVSEEVYWKDYYLESDIHYEWNNGRLEEKPVSDYETYLVYAWFVQLLQQFLIERPIARTVALEMGFRLSLPSGVVVRKPDFGVVRNDNPQPLLPLDVSYHGVFDLCIEALSDKERRDVERDLIFKRAEYAAGGVPEYYILHREPERQAFFTRASGGVYVPIAPQDGIVRSRVLPGLQFRLADLCERPELKTMRHDPVYADFVLPQWREAETRARAQELRADAESQRAEVESQRAEVESQRAKVESQRAKVESQRAAAEQDARRLAEDRAEAEGRRAAAEQAARQLAQDRAEAEAQARLRAEQELAALRALLAQRGPES
jgi:hypothetical protein